MTAGLRLVPLHADGKVRLVFSHLDALARVEAEFPAFAMRPNRFDDMARWIVGKPQQRLKHAANLKRNQARSGRQRDPSRNAAAPAAL